MGNQAYLAGELGKARNAFDSPEMENVHEAVWEEHDPLTDTHWNKCPSGQINRALLSGAIAIFRISTPPQHERLEVAWNKPGLT